MPQALGLQRSLHQYAARCLSCHRQIWNRLGRNTWQHKKEQQNFSTETTETSPSQFGVSSATVAVLLILHLSALELGIKSEHWQYPLPKHTNSDIQKPNSTHLPNALMSARRKLFAQLMKWRMKHSFLQHSREKWHAKPSFHVRRATHWACLCISRRHSRCMVWPQGMTVMSFIESNKYCTKHNPTCK
jgi:hypothetical protein